MTIHRKRCDMEKMRPLFHELPVYGVLWTANMFTWHFACEQFWRVTNQQPNWKFITRKLSMSFHWTLNLGLFVWFFFLNDFCKFVYCVDEKHFVCEFAHFDYELVGFFHFRHRPITRVKQREKEKKIKGDNLTEKRHIALRLLLLVAIKKKERNKRIIKHTLKSTRENTVKVISFSIHVKGESTRVFTHKWFFT